VSRLNGRLSRLETSAATARGPAPCARCRLRHVQPLTIALLQSIMVVRTDMPRLCLCDPCCGDPRERAIALMTHGRPSADDAA